MKCKVCSSKITRVTGCMLKKGKKWYCYNCMKYRTDSEVQE